MATHTQVVYRDAEDHLEWKRAQAALLAAAHKEAETYRQALRLVQQELAMGHPHWAQETVRRALFPPKEESSGRILG